MFQAGTAFFDSLWGEDCKKMSNGLSVISDFLFVELN